MQFLQSHPVLGRRLWVPGDDVVACRRPLGRSFRRPWSSADVINAANSRNNSLASIFFPRFRFFSLAWAKIDNRRERWIFLANLTKPVAPDETPVYYTIPVKPSNWPLMRTVCPGRLDKSSVRKNTGCRTVTETLLNFMTGSVSRSSNSWKTNDGSHANRNPFDRFVDKCVVRLKYILQLFYRKTQIQCWVQIAIKLSR